MDAGIIKNFKINYRTAYLKHLISQIETESFDAAVGNINILQAIQWIKEAWNNVSAAIVQNCFHHCHIARGEEVDDNPFITEAAAPQSESCSDDVLQLLPSAVEYDLYPDNSLSTCAAAVVNNDLLLDQCIAQSIEPVYYASTDDSDDDIICVELASTTSAPSMSTSCTNNTVIQLQLALT